MRIGLYHIAVSGVFPATMLASTLLVTSAEDTDTAGTFRYALNNAVNGDTIEFLPGIGTITLASNLPVITQDLEIVAAATQEIDGANAYRVFAVGNDSSSPTVSMTNISVVNGIAQGGSGGYTYYGGGGGGGLGAGGGFFVKGSTTLTSVSIKQCQAVGGDGGNGADSASTQNSGGGGGGGSFSTAAVDGQNAYPISQGGNGGGDGGGSGATSLNQPGGNATEIGGGGGGAAPSSADSGAVGGDGGVGLYGGGGGGAGSGATPDYAGGNGGAAGFGGGGGGAGKGGVPPVPSGGSGGVLGGDGGATDLSIHPDFYGAGGGGGSGVGGAIFVYTGSSLTLAGAPDIRNGAVSGGAAGTSLPTSQGGNPGSGFAEGIFLDQDSTLSLQGAFDADFAIDSYSSRVDGGVTLLDGVVTLSQDNSYQGPTLVSRGVLVVNGSIESSSLTTVSSGATLKGVGRTGALHVEGALRPGHSVGTLSSGPVTFTPSSLYQVEIDSSGASRLQVTGTATLDGTLQVLQGAGPARSSAKVPILTTTDGITGAFATVQYPPGFRFSLEQTSKDLFLIYSALIPTRCLCGNALAVADRLNECSSMSTLNLLNGLDGCALQEALNSISPSRNAYSAWIEAQNAFTLSELLSSHVDHLRDIDDLSLCGAMVSMPSPAGSPCTSVLPESQNPAPFSTWISGLANFAHGRGDHQNPSFSFNSEGVLAGFDYRRPRVGLLGFSLGYMHTDFHDQCCQGSGQIQSGFASLYGDCRICDFCIEPALWGMFNDALNSRHILFPGFSGEASSKIVAWQLVPHLLISYLKSFSWGDVMPFTSADYAVNWQRGYCETGCSPFNATQQSHATSMIRSETGLKLTDMRTFSWGALFLKGRASYIFEKPFGQTVTACLGCASSALTVTALNRELNLGSIGLEILFSRGTRSPLNVYLSYDGQFGKHYTSNEIALTIEKIF